MQGNVQELIDLKESVIQHLTPLIENSAADAEQKFLVLLTAAKSAGTYPALRSAYDAALKIEDEGARADALLDVLGEADLQIQSVNTPVSAERATSEGNPAVLPDDYHSGQ